MDEDEQTLEQPIIKPVRNIKFEVGVKHSSTYVSTQFLVGLMSNPTLVRNVALVGHLQHGKTVFMDILIEQLTICLRLIKTVRSIRDTQIQGLMSKREGYQSKQFQWLLFLRIAI
ncbi:P-loop containing nucleoside triphosphate hydrolase [Parasponia andersonii]|uniref:P-loop containing nucleoside triphosphate hydrolase n=1 Tax=Parasponia andersonii TaxID=3476 RepID=A0A2P5BBI4_PARAD|nr:P-loop containing nucleoside triphosphate hydrolase [Parasponia andersonii]